MTSLHDVFLGLGGNVGEPDKAMCAALAALDARPDTTVVAVSSLYRTPPWGKTDQPDFLNAAAHIRTRLEPKALLEACLDIERGLKRVRDERWGPRSIDIDILLYDEVSIEAEGLVIPHPRMAERAFVLLPLSEIAPERRLEGVRIGDLLQRLDLGGIEKRAPADQWWKPQAG
ncbi:2-amino-4-hydroxy-6-hydroxymethyldihydropteridine diphosphokinase [Nitratireductor sp. ZSWI3]|uniref:2-amino-4-hydroxy-6- hydroxymethyldihydropteridine diphosphokinase n=1 Tax=Nitratireductor sp. ZSWI3 TaxID=2966359 RepID=UPI00214FBAF9|nr:2-amino-4-hydroxy-6-hydroxymethyldihydropteridine diphosphokinase [Nitratireductor sp. ZSWI3]MCR4268917.1 2-amino-4-hydroxy-6-hydroxymethyldihydropteridine diphosphokinase [Nitratireductor sp. ZSWI3]